MLKITQVVTANREWRVALVNMRDPENPNVDLVHEMIVVAWALLEGEDDEHPDQERRHDFVQRVIPLVNFGNVIQNPMYMTEFLGVLEPGKKIKDYHTIAKERRARLAAQIQAAKQERKGLEVDGHFLDPGTVEDGGDGQTDQSGRAPDAVRSKAS